MEPMLTVDGGEILRQFSLSVLRPGAPEQHLPLVGDYNDRFDGYLDGTEDGPADQARPHDQPGPSSVWRLVYRHNRAEGLTTSG
jgi:hypothetical protein